MSDKSLATQGPAPVAPYDRNTMSFSDMVNEGVAEVQGNQLVKDDILDELIGVPFLITRLTFRKGLPDPANKTRVTAYVSCEAVIADETYLKRRKVNLDDKPFLPGDHVVFNDGSTGIYRQIVMLLEGLGYIALPDGPVSGARGTTKYDTAPSDWVDVFTGEREIGEVTSEDAGFMVYTVDVRLLCPRGLRVSEYGSDYGDAETRYLA